MTFGLRDRIRRKNRSTNQTDSIFGANSSGSTVNTPLSPGVGTGEITQPPSNDTVSNSDHKEPRLGLFRLDSESTNSDPLLSTFHLDIIALHGLNGNAFSTWTLKNQLWLRDFLPTSLPGSRVYTFGYDSAIFGASKAEIGDFARGLLSALDLERRSDEQKRRGIVFICHSLGGIVCKKALIVAHENSLYKNILDSTKAIVFFGTPHGGSEHADMLSVVVKIVGTMGSLARTDHIFGSPRKHLANLLRPSSKELENISISFTERTSGFQIISFYEQNVMPPFDTLIVPLSSTRIGVINEQIIPLAADHRAMCRLDEQSLAFRKIVDLCEKVETRSSEHDPNRDLNIQEQECLWALHTIDMKDCRDQLNRRAPGTCDWISSNDQFKRWTTEKQSSLLCIVGGLGTGKSIFMSYLVDELSKNHSEEAIICSFFCDDKDVGRNHGQAILRSLLYQILSQRHDLMGHATARLSNIKPDRWSISKLWEILKAIFLDPKSGHFILGIDAIDECEESSRHEVMKLVREFLEEDHKEFGAIVNFFISSRDNVDFMEDVNKYGRIVSLSESGEVERDIELAVKDELDKIEKNLGWSTETRKQLEVKIVKKAGRNFQWVRLVTAQLKRGPQISTYFERVIDECKDLDGAYCHILAAIESEQQELAAKILRILVGSVRPLTTTEFQVALAINAGHETLGDVEELYDPVIERTIRFHLGPLVSIRNSQVQLGHQSVKEFLLRLGSGKVTNLQSEGPDLNKLYGSSLNASYLELATICVDFLALDDFDETTIFDENASAFSELPGATEDSPWFLMRQASGFQPGNAQELTSSDRMTLTDQKPPFFEYSARYWTSYVCGLTQPTPIDLLQSCIRISRSGSACLSNWSDQYRASSKEWVVLPVDLDPLIIAAFFGHAQLAREVLENHQSETQDNSKPLALCWASRMGHMGVVQTLLDHGTPVTGAILDGAAPLSWACYGGYLEITELLLNKTGGSQVNILDENGRSPLSLAVGSGNLPITKLLIARNDVDVNLPDRTGSSPLFWIIGSKPDKQDLKVLKYLLSEPRVNLTHRDRYGRTVLSWAAEMGALEAVNILINCKRPDVQSLLDDPGDTGKGWSPLSWAAYNGHLNVVEALCKTRKIDTQLASVDHKGQNAISLATDRNQAKIIEVLSKFYPQGVDLGEESGRNPLSCAMWGGPGNISTVRTLLKTGLVDVNNRSTSGATPLHFAAGAGRDDLIRILVEEGGADLDIKDNDGFLPGDKYIDWRTPLVRAEIARLRELRSSAKSV